MSLPVWPSGLPYMPLTNAFSVKEPHISPAETEYEGGAYRRRPKATVRRALFPMGWVLDDTQFQSFRNFYHLTLAEGSLRFTVQVPDGTGGAYIARTCQFRGMYQASQPQPPYWSISAELYVFGGI